MRKLTTLLTLTVGLGISFGASAAIDASAIDKRALKPLKPVTEHPLPSLRAANSAVVKQQLRQVHLMADIPALGRIGLNNEQLTAVRQNLERNGIQRVD